MLYFREPCFWWNLMWFMFPLCIWLIDWLKLRVILTVFFISDTLFMLPKLERIIHFLLVVFCPRNHRSECDISTYKFTEIHNEPSPQDDMFTSTYMLTAFLQRLQFTRLRPQMKKPLLVQPGSWAGSFFPGQEILLLSLRWVLPASISCWPCWTSPARDVACLYWVREAL